MEIVFSGHYSRNAGLWHEPGLVPVPCLLEQHTLNQNKPSSDAFKR
jgi:hypothetical protein